MMTRERLNTLRSRIIISGKEIEELFLAVDELLREKEEPPNICYVCKAPATYHFLHWYCDSCHDAQKEKWGEE